MNTCRVFVIIKTTTKCTSKLFLVNSDGRVINRKHTWHTQDLAHLGACGHVSRVPNITRKAWPGHGTRDWQNMPDTHASAARTLGAHFSRWVSTEGHRSTEARLAGTHRAAQSSGMCPAHAFRRAWCERTLFFSQPEVRP